MAHLHTHNGVQAIAYGTFTPAFLDKLAAFLRGKAVLEVFAGNGLLARLLGERGVAVQATTLFSGHDGHEHGLHHPVLEMDALAAVRQLGPTADVLLASWPTTTERMADAALAWGPDRDIVFIGEVTDYARGHLGGCATDRFFEIVRVQKEFPSYRGNIMEKAAVMRVMRTA